ncbi:beta-glucosidase [Consotaella salsifontis]|uniref:Beta-glucosidase n=1 Tax=Consotaella salsifontis TaxID=1365950 RepID=A0A1T4MPK4_9HYPH|nr:glycoside hydrolase family 3 protein [Consotaella salsifontis]SJZ68658.1 beta-glucosidase [Consotaella salsifontis]
MSRLKQGPIAHSHGLGTADEADLRRKIAGLTLEEKVRLLAGADNWSMPSEPKIGLRAVIFSDGPNGVRGFAWGHEENLSALLPAVSSLAATWDEDLLVAVGRMLAAEARRKGVDVLLGPGVNLQRSPLGGRNFEYFSEDPLLTARLAVAYVAGLQGEGVGACVKHFVCNETETGRMCYDVSVDERTLREAYLLPFEMTVKAGAASVMAAYNGLSGQTMTVNGRLNDGVLKGEWGFDGALISDWTATRNKLGAVLGGLDLAMPGPDLDYRRVIAVSVESGEVPQEVVDDHLLRVLRLAARVGGFSRAPATGPERPPREMAPLLRELAARCMTLLKNEPVAGQPLLPLGSPPASIALIGPMTNRPTLQGGGSASLTPPMTISPAEGLRAALGDSTRIELVEGVTAHRLLPDLPLDATQDPETGEPGLRVNFYAADGSLLESEHRRTSRLLWAGHSAGALPAGTSRIEVRGRLTADESGEHQLAVAGCGMVVLRLRDQDEHSIDLDGDSESNFEYVVKPHQAVVSFSAKAGDTIDIVASRVVETRELDIFVPLGFGYRGPGAVEDERIRQAAEAARQADVAIVVVGNTDQEETEAFDRPSLDLPGRQDELVEAVLAANPNTIIVVNAASPVIMPWAERASAILWSGLGGQEYGAALADVLLGRSEPSGRLAASLPRRVEDVPVLETLPVAGRHVYAEGLKLGYRGYVAAGKAPLFAFGHGLGYGDWEYADAAAERHDGADPADLDAIGAVVSVSLTNRASRSSREVVQIYADAPQGDKEAAPIALVGFAVVTAGPGETVRVDLPIRARLLARYGASGWEMPTGPRRLQVSRSAQDHRLTLDL